MFHYIDNQLLVPCPNVLVSHLIEELKTELKNEIQANQEPWQTLILDLSEVPKIDVHGIHFIMDLHYEMQEKGKDFMLIGCNELVLQTIKLYRLDKLRPIGINKTSAQLAEEKMQHDAKKSGNFKQTHNLTREERLEQFKNTHH